ncbi:Arm DNA-binding domain-containing protein [Salmonella enterica]|uniref:Arm DNA-binding domain-containing protein n=1 Tax=Salmonella enterica TaxID=28901 RepID=UPI003F75177B
MSLTNAQIRSIKPSDNPFKLIDSHGRYLLVNPGWWVRRSRSAKCDAMFSPSGAFPAVDVIISDRYPVMVMELAAQ